MRVKLFVAITALIFAASCGNPSPGPEKQAPPSPSVSPDSTPVEEPSPSAFEREIGDSKGLMVLTRNYGREDTIRIYNSDGSPWYEFSYYDEEGFDELANLNTDFKPFAFHPDYLLLGLRVVGEDDRRYEVVVNEESDLRKFVRKDDDNLMYEEFGPNILTAFAIEFDPAANPLLDARAGKKIETDYSKITRFEPSQVDGDWLRLDWKPQEKDEKAGNSAVSPDKSSDATGWIRWRKGTKMLVKIYYIS